MNLKKYILLAIIATFIATQMYGQDCTLNTIDKQITFPDSVTQIVPNFPAGPTDPPDGPITRNHNYRDVVWVHGMGGNSGSWSRASSYARNGSAEDSDKKFKGWQIYNKIADYSNSQSSFEVAGSSLQSDLNSHNWHDIEELDQNFIIAHSLGGLASRQMDLYYDREDDPEKPKPYGGIITFGSPHAGARIAFAQEHNGGQEVGELFTGACSALGAGPAEEALRLFPVNFGWLNIEGFVDNTCEKGAGLLVPLAAGLFNAGSIGDLIPESAALQTLKQHDENARSGLHKIAFFGVEDDETNADGSGGDLIWRFFHSALNGPNNKDLWEGDQDKKAIENANNMRMKYQENYEFWHHQLFWGERIPLPPGMGLFFQIILVKKNGKTKAYSSKKIKKLINAWKKGVDWIDNANENYKFMIGALEYEFEEQLYCQDEFSLEPTPISSADECDCEHCELIVERTMILKKNDTDGLVNEKSARDYPGAIHGEDTKMDGSNHFQMRNDKKTRVMLLRIFNGIDDDFFYTEEKEN